MGKPSINYTIISRVLTKRTIFGNFTSGISDVSWQFSSNIFKMFPYDSKAFDFRSSIITSCWSSSMISADANPLRYAFVEEDYKTYF